MISVGRNSLRCQKLVSEAQSFGLDTVPQSFCYSFIVLLSITRCSKSVQKFAVPVCQVATVVTESTQLQGTKQGSKPIYIFYLVN